MYNTKNSANGFARVLKRTCGLVGVGAAMAALSQTAAASCTYNVDNEWNSGFVASITIKNDTNATINGWNVNWQYASNRMSGGWNANFSGSNPYGASNLSWNSSIAPGQSVSFGVQGEKVNGVGAERPAVTGSACGGGTTPSSTPRSSVAPSSVAPSSVAPSSIPKSSSSIAGSSSSANNQNTVCPSDPQKAFQMYAPNVPVTVQAEDFDPAGYSDSDTANQGGAYRTDTAVDIKQIAGGNAIGWMTAGEWLEYTINVETEGDYDVTIRSGSDSDGRTIKLSQCSTTLIESFAVPKINNWGEFKTWSAGKIHLKPGFQKIRVTVGAQDYLDLDWIHIGPYNGTIDPKTSSSSSVASSTPRSSSSAASTKKFIGNITTGGAVRSDFNRYWNQITGENEGKWGSVEGTRDVYNWAPVDRIYAYARANNIPVKAHTFVWGAQSPSWINNLSASETAAEIEEWIHDYCARYPDTAMIDVVNEAVPGHQPAGYAQKAFGNNWIQKVFQLARQYCPNSILILNDYNNIRWQHNEFIALAKPLAQGGYIDAVGLQSHELKGMTGAQVKTAIDNIWNQLGKPIYISEYDIGDTNDQVQLQNFQAHFPVFWDHPHVKGITIWGYVNGRTWIDGSGLMQDNGTPRPAMTWLLNNYINK